MRTVLVVDDDRSIAEVVSQALSDEGYAVAIARDGLEALERVAADQPALVVLDLMMPRLDGFGFLDRLRQECDGVRPAVIVMSARSGPDDIAEAIEKGANDFLTKPFDLEELLLRVRLRVARASDAHALADEPGMRRGGLEIYTFGGLRLVSGGRQLFDENWRNRTAKKLFKYLFTQRGQRLSKESIVAMVWPGSEPEAGLNNLRVNMHVLRQTLSTAARDADPEAGDGVDLGKEFLLQQHGFYYFNTEAPYWSDVDAYEQHVKAGRAGQIRGDADTVISEYGRAVRLYRGPYLPEDVYDELLTRERNRLREEFLIVAGELMKGRSERGEYEDAVDVGRQIVREDPSREGAYRGLMRYLALLGRRDEALQLYHRATDALRGELGVEPMPETRQLYDRIRSTGSV